jgi:plasminogen activator
MSKIAALSAAALALMLAAPAVAQDISMTTADGAVEFSAGMGVTALQGEEIVYFDVADPTVVSHLFWQSLAPVLSASLDVTIPNGWTIDANVQVGIGGNSYMEDYDWIDPASYDFDDWSDRSQHPDTRLYWYFNGQMFVGHDFHVNDGVKVNVNAGVKYVNVQWTAYGGSYVYSSGAGSPRDQAGTFPAGEKGITLNQFFPAALAGIDAEFDRGAWVFDVAAHGGMTFLAGDNDFHWMRTDIGPGGGLFDDILDSAPVVQLSGTAKYALSDSLDMFLTGTYEEVFTARGGTDVYGLDGMGGSSYLGSFPDAAGGNFRAASITAGLSGQF